MIVYTIAGLAITLLADAFPPKRQLTVQVQRGASAHQRIELADRAILLDQALSAGWGRTDPAVLAYLERSLRVTHPDLDGYTLLRLAEDLGLHWNDTVVRSILVDRTQRLLENRELDMNPTDSVLQRHLDDHGARFIRPETATFSAAWFPLDSTGLRRARELMAYADKTTTPADLHQTGNHLPGLRPRQTMSLDKIGDRYGKTVSSAIASCPVLETCGPVESALGWFVVRVELRLPPHVPPLADIRNEVLGDWTRIQRQRNLERELEELRRRYRIVWEPTG